MYRKFFFIQLMSSIIPVILCGGSGSRLFPLSRKNIPKQFLVLEKNGLSLLQNTIVRLWETGLVRVVSLMTNKAYLHILKYQLHQLAQHAPELQYEIFLEPESRNTCPAIGFLLSYYYNFKSFSGNLLFLPADHVYDGQEFARMMKLVQQFHTDKKIVIFGINPTYPETGFGYIEFEGDGVKSFKEKPDVDTAREYIRTGKFCWNSGMFMFNKEVLPHYAAFNRTTYDKLQALIPSTSLSDDNVFTISSDYSECEDISIDYALMEKVANEATLVRYNGFWSDIGSYNSLVEYSQPYHAFSSANNYVNTKKTVIANGVKDLAIVETDDLILVSDLSMSQNVKNVYNGVPKELLHNHMVDYRPWGFYEVLKDEPNFKLKKITVYPGKRLSLQSHKYRSEHWICISGEGKAEINDISHPLVPNTQVFIAYEDKHRLVNDSQSELAIIEIQTGSYFGEDDIVRYEDDYNRV